MINQSGNMNDENQDESNYCLEKCHVVTNLRLTISMLRQLLVSS